MVSSSSSSSSSWFMARAGLVMRGPYNNRPPIGNPPSDWRRTIATALPAGAAPGDNRGEETVMAAYRPTHEVLNQPPPLAGYNLFEHDTPIAEALEREGGP